MIPAPLYHPPVSIDRRKVSVPARHTPELSAPNSTSRLGTKARTRQRPFPHLLTTSETTYAFLSLCLVVFVFIVISVIDANSVIPTLFNRFPRSVHVSVNATRPFLSRFSATGSAKQLDALIHSIIAHSQHSSPSTPSSLIITVAVNYAYRKLAVNFVCNLRRLNISNYVILAMDRASFDYLSQRDVHVFFHHLNHEPILRSQLMKSIYASSHNHSKSHTRRLLAAPLSSNLSASSSKHSDKEDVFGTSAFVETSRRKSLLVLRILSLGYSVLFSDVDVIWVTNPVPHMLQYPEHFVLQSDLSAKLRDSSPNFNVNSGLYLARAAPQTIVALRAIIKYSYAIRRSEQKAFNYVLCGAFKDHHAGPGSRVGTTQCEYSSSSTTAKILPLDSFPNGSDNELWRPSKSFGTDHPRIIAIHANYISGREEKISRIRNIGFWFQSDDAHSRDECLFPVLN